MLIECGRTTLYTVRHMYRNRDGCILYEEANVVLLVVLSKGDISVIIVLRKRALITQLSVTGMH